MKKFVMLKDLPWMKEGQVFWIEDETIVTIENGRRIICAAEPYQAFYNYFQEDFDAYNGNGWFEEVKEETVGRWKPKNGDDYYFIDSEGVVDCENYEKNYCNDEVRIKNGNCFQTEQLAQEERLRRESIAKRWDFVPKDGEKYWYCRGGDAICLYFNIDDHSDIDAWNVGNCQRTREDAEKWGETYAQYFLPPQA